MAERNSPNSLPTSDNIAVVGNLHADHESGTVPGSVVDSHLFQNTPDRDASERAAKRSVRNGSGDSGAETARRKMYALLDRYR